MTPSIRRRLLYSLLTLTVTVWLFTALASYRDALHEVDELFDAQLAQTARTLLAVAENELEYPDELESSDVKVHQDLPKPAPGAGHKYEYKVAYQLWQQPQGQLLMRSFTAPHTSMSEHLSGYSTAEINGESWRIFALHDSQNGFQVQVGEALAIRGELADYIVWRIGQPVVIALPLLALLIWLVVDRNLLLLKRLAAAVSKREADNLEPVDTGQAPEEVKPLVEALNKLFKRLGRAFENERRFTADAAHELRTPLAALKVQAQVAMRSTAEKERHEALQHVLDGVDRASRMVEQLLILARIDSQQTPTPKEVIELRPLCETQLVELAGAAKEKEIELEFHSENTTTISGIADSMVILLRNLLDNAIRYTPRGGRIRLSLTRGEHDETLLRIEDSGPGIPAEERERIFERFYRLAGQESSGSGLGLSIVRRIAELHGAELSLDEASTGGLAVTVRFPPAHEG